MNWMGGARSRVKAISEKKKQREFFEKRRRSTHLYPMTKTSTIPALSQDLISVYLSQRNSSNKSLKSKPTQVIKQDLDYAPKPFNFNLPETPFYRQERVESKSLTNELNDKPARDLKGDAFGIDQCNITENQKPEPKSNSLSRNLLSFTSFRGGSEYYNKNDAVTNGRGLNGGMRNSSLESSYELQNGNFSSTRDACFFPPTPDVHEGFKKYVCINRMNQRNNDKLSSFQSPSEPNLENFLEKTFHRDNSNLNPKQKLFKKSKEIENIEAFLEKKENQFTNKRGFSYSELSKQSFSSIPMKVNRNDEINEISTPMSNKNNTSFDNRNCRQSLEELEEMIRKSNTTVYSPQHNTNGLMENCGQPASSKYFDPSNTIASPFSSTSSSSSGGITPSFFKRKRKHGDYNTEKNLQTSCQITAVKKIRTSVTDSEGKGLKQTIVNHKRKIKIQDTTLLTPQTTDLKYISNGTDKYYESKTHTFVETTCIDQKFCKPLFPSSFTSLFPTPRFKASPRIDGSGQLIDNYGPPRAPNSHKTISTSQGLNDTTFQKSPSAKIRVYPNAVNEEPESSLRCSAAENPTNGNVSNGFLPKYSKNTAEVATSPFLELLPTNSTSVKNSFQNHRVEGKLEGENMSQEKNSRHNDTKELYLNSKSSKSNCEDTLYNIDYTHQGSSTPSVTVGTSKKDEERYDQVSENDNVEDLDSLPPTVPTTPTRNLNKNSKMSSEDSACLQQKQMANRTNLNPTSTFPFESCENEHVTSLQTDMLEKCSLQLIKLKEPNEDEFDEVNCLEPEETKMAYQLSLSSQYESPETPIPDQHQNDEFERIERSSFRDRMEDTSPFLMNISTYMKNMSQNENRSKTSSAVNTPNARSSALNHAIEKGKKCSTPESLLQVTLTELQNEQSVMELQSEPIVRLSVPKNGIGSVAEDGESNCVPLENNSKEHEFVDQTKISSFQLEEKNRAFINTQSNVEAHNSTENFPKGLFSHTDENLETYDTLDITSSYKNRFYHDKTTQTILAVTDSWCQIDEHLYSRTVSTQTSQN